MNFFNNLRKKIITKYLLKTATDRIGELEFYWQSRFFVFFKILTAVILIYFLFPLHLEAGKYLEQGFNFFKLSEIFNFKFPEGGFFIKISKYFFILVILYYGIIFLSRQIESFFSALVVNKTDKKVYYIKNRIIIKNLFVFSMTEMTAIVLKQNLVSGIFNYGTIVFQKPAGDEIKIGSLKNARLAIRTISSMKDAAGV